MNIFKPGDSSLQKSERKLRKIEDKLYEDCTAVLSAVCSDAFDIDPASTELPAEWLREIQETPEEEQEAKRREFARRKRIAMYALLPNKSAPVALQIAQKCLMGMQKARAMTGAGSGNLNINVVSITAPMPMFPEKEIDVE